ncbi:MAG TPA: DUF3592 domain-containing protein [Thermoanaerobaculia bacterium]|jgi:hypothetical protein
MLPSQSSPGARFAPPPRRVPLSLSVLYVCNFLAVFGWLFLGMGMLGTMLFVGHADLGLASLRAHTVGRVTAVEKTNASEDDRPVKANHYEFSVAGRPFQGTSFSTGEQVSPGDEVTVEYDDANPSASRILGMRRAHFGRGVLFVLLFPIIGAFFVLGGTRSGLRRARLLRDGVVTTGRLLSRHPTNVRINDQPVWELTFEFTARDGRKCEAKARTTDPSRLEDEAQEPLLYDPNDPSCAYVLDELPQRPEVEMNGEFRGRPLAALLASIIPLIAIGANAVAAYVMMH